MDTSVAVPLLVQTHRARAEVTRWWEGQEIALCGQALAETYSVLTRLPGDARMEPTDAALLLRERFARPFVLRAEATERAFRGELVPQSPSDEPASVLLERIRAERAESSDL